MGDSEAPAIPETVGITEAASYVLTVLDGALSPIDASRSAKAPTRKMAKSQKSVNNVF